MLKAVAASVRVIVQTLNCAVAVVGNEPVMPLCELDLFSTHAPTLAPAVPTGYLTHFRTVNDTSETHSNHVESCTTGKLSRKTHTRSAPKLEHAHVDTSQTQDTFTLATQLREAHVQDMTDTTVMSRHFVAGANYSRGVGAYARGNNGGFRSPPC